MSGITLGLDIGTNSVGSAWIDTQHRIIQLGASVFPAGIEESDQKRGAPKNQARRGFRQRRRNVDRKADRKHHLRKFLMSKGWIPKDIIELQRWTELNPWILRRDGLERELSPYEFGRILLHMIQRRGAFGFIDEQDFCDTEQDNDTQTEKEDNSNDKEQKIKGAIDQTKKEMRKLGIETFGHFIAVKYEERKHKINKGSARETEIRFPVRNRTTATGEGTYEYCADRDMIWNEFDKLWKKQKSFQSTLSEQLTTEVRKELDDPSSDATWRYKGLLFGQRKTYWDMGTLGRCSLEPTDMRCPKADMYAQEFLALETVNNIRIIPLNEPARRLNSDERALVLKALRLQKTASEGTIRKALKIHTAEKKRLFSLSLDQDAQRDLNTDWFYREIISGAIGETAWKGLIPEKKESINQAILKHDPKEEKDKVRFTQGCKTWWDLDDEQTQRLIAAWQKRPNIDKRVNFSRRAILNLLPYLREGWTVNEARKLFAEDADNGASDEQRKRYGFKESITNRAMRRYIQKHPDLLPPAPQEISNPVVRKAIHEVRRHINEYIRKFGKKPDRVIVELAREARQSAKVCNQMLAKNRKQEKIKKEIIETYDSYIREHYKKKYGVDNLTHNQQENAIRRVLLCREQKGVCPYSDTARNITERMAAIGEGLEIDHIIPRSRGGNSTLNNLVLCFDGTNRGKGNKTPQEWLTKEDFAKLEQRMAHLKKENPTKWENLHKEVTDIQGFVNSQLTDTAYASRQVANWLKDVLYDGERDGVRRVFTTKGVYTSIIRKDWQLFLNGSDEPKFQKDRSDHRHHALDALAVAFCGPEMIQKVACVAQKREMAKSEGNYLGKRIPFDPPWGDHDSFRQQVMAEVDKLIVAHRPESRKITGALHNDTQYGPVVEDGKRLSHCTIRKSVAQLSPNHLRVPDGWEHLRIEMENAPTKAFAKAVRSEMLKLPDVTPGKSGIIRDRWFREELREYLRCNNLDPDNFTAKQIQELVKNKGVFLRSGVPVRRITLLRSPTVREIQRKRWNDATGMMEYYPEEEKNALRLYEPQNNHHIEIRENEKGKWVGNVVTNFEAAKRVRPPKSSGLAPQPAVNRDDMEHGKFVMSLSIGEMVYMKHPKTGKPGYFSVFKIDSTNTVHFTPHWDAGRSKATDSCTAREDIALSLNNFSKMGVEADMRPQKVWVSPLGEVKFLVRD